MKKLFLILLLFLFSCGDNNTNEISEEKYKKLKGDTTTLEQPKEIIWNDYEGDEQKVYIIKIENHEMMYGFFNNYGAAFYMVHHPDCKTCKSDTTNGI